MVSTNQNFKNPFYIALVISGLLMAIAFNECSAQYPQGVQSPQPGYYGPVPGATYYAPGAPPPPQQEVIIAAPSPEYVWTPGYWHWQNGWIWIGGQWALPPRPGMRWHGPEWHPHEGERFRLQHGEWR
jgi:hypothetical protein